MNVFRWKMTTKWLFTFKHFKFPLLPLLTHSVLCVLKWVLKWDFPGEYRITLVSCLIFLHCVLSNVSSNCLPDMMHNHIGCICELSCHHNGNFCHDGYPSLPSIWCMVFCCFCPTESTRKNMIRHYVKTFALNFKQLSSKMWCKIIPIW